MATELVTHWVCTCSCHDCCVPQEASCEDCEEDHDPETGLPKEGTADA